MRKRTIAISALGWLLAVLPPISIAWSDAQSNTLLTQLQPSSTVSPLPLAYSGNPLPAACLSSYVYYGGVFPPRTGPLGVDCLELASAPMLTTTSTADWQQIPITLTAPSGRYIYGLAYDSYRKVTVLFGGDNTGAARLNDTWEYNGTNWRQITPPQSPPGRVNIDQTLVYDSSRRKIVLFGGLASNGYLNDTWEYDGTTWSLINTTPTPGNRDSYAMVFDDHRGVAVLFGGYGNTGSRLNDTWEYNGTWQQVNTAQAPVGRYFHSMAFDSHRGVTILFGGLDSNNTKLADTWEYDGTNWRQIIPSQSPPPRNAHTMTYDSARGVVVLFGGSGNAGLLNDTWEFDGTTWRQVTTPHSPLPRTEMSMIYDGQRRKSVFFGGGYWGSGLTTFRETWEYSAPSTYTVYLPLAMINFVTYFNGPWEVEPNNSAAEANGPLRSGQDYFGYPDDAKDYFSFISAASGSISIDLTNYTGGNGQLQLFYQSTGNRVAAVTSAPFSINYTGLAGLYYIYISTGSSYNNFDPYTLRVTYP